jgi:transposase
VTLAGVREFRLLSTLPVAVDLGFNSLVASTCVPGTRPDWGVPDLGEVTVPTFAGVTLEQVAGVFGVGDTCLQNWLGRDAVESGACPVVSGSEAAESRLVRKHIRRLEQENEVPRRAAACLSQANLKLGGSLK